MKKSLKVNRVYILIAVALASSSPTAYSQNSSPGQQTDVKSMVTGKKFLFEPKSATPSGGRLINLSYGYYLRVSGDTLESNLPYYGRATSPAFDPSESGFRFTSLSFDYTVTDRKKGGWDISVKPKDQNEIRELFFTVFENGSTTLRATSLNRQNISYQGNVGSAERKK